MYRRVFKYLRALCWALDHKRGHYVVKFAVILVTVNVEIGVDSLGR